jgi:Cu/Ag efflux protein CusF
MKKVILASAIAISICIPAAVAQQTTEGTVTKVDRLNSTIAIRQIPAETVGASAPAAAEEFKVKDSSLLEPVHAGDKVTFSVAETGGVKTITRLERQKP